MKCGGTMKNIWDSGPLERHAFSLQFMTMHSIPCVRRCSEKTVVLTRLVLTTWWWGVICLRWCLAQAGISNMGAITSRSQPGCYEIMIRQVRDNSSVWLWESTTTRSLFNTLCLKRVENRKSGRWLKNEGRRRWNAKTGESRRFISSCVVLMLEDRHE